MLVVAAHGQHHDRDFGLVGEDGGGGGFPSAAGEVEVHQHRVGLDVGGDLDRLPGGAGFADDLDVVDAGRRTGSFRTFR